MKITLFLLILILITSILQARSPWLGKDKAAHFTYSAALTYWNYGVAKNILGNSQRESVIISINFTAILGAAKELSDKEINGSFWSWHDIVYDLAGIGCGMILINNFR